MDLVAIASYDAGGAELISSWVRHNPGNYFYALEGPARKIFLEKFPDLKIVTIEFALSKCDLLLSGTGWQTNFEKNAIATAKNKGKKSIAFIDHWVNYLERFKDGNKFYFPDEIWVTDEYALNIANKTFPLIPVTLKENNYLNDMAKVIGPAIYHLPILKKNVLYICEPIKRHSMAQYGEENALGYSEEDALIFFIDNIYLLGEEIGLVTIRPHPSESIDKYKWVVDKYSENQNFIQIKLGGMSPLYEEIQMADILVGCESMAMIVGLLANRRVISSIPSNGRICQLPHVGIDHLSKMLEGVK